MRVTHQASLRMKKIILSIVAFAVLAIVAIFASAYFNRSDEPPVNLPWQIETTAEGHTRVFGVDVGSSTLRAAMEAFHKVPDVALFRTPEGKYRLEAYFGKVVLAFFEARVIVSLEASDQDIAEIEANSPERKPMPSGSWELTLRTADVEAAAKRVIRRLSYSPVADIEAERLAKFFGKPAETLSIGDKSQYWLYPERGLAILVEQENKEILYYVALADFPQLKAELLEFAQAAEERVKAEEEK